MRIAGLDKLNKFKLKHSDSEQKILAWVKEVENAKWQSPQDIKKRYSSASILDRKTVIFNLKGNKYRLAIHVSFNKKQVSVQFIGTHSEYDRWSKRRKAK